MLDTIRGWIKDVWKAVVDFFGDLLLFFLQMVLDVVLWVLEAIPVPEFMQQFTLQSAFSGLDPTLLYVVDQLNIPEALAIVGAAFGFRLLRKALTLFQW